MRTKFSAFLLLLVFAVGTTQAAPDKPLALVTDISGDVTVERAEDGATVSARWGQQLYEGDEVRTGTDATVAIMFTNNNLITLGGNSALTISGSSNEPAPSQDIRTVDPAVVADASALSLHRTGMGEVSALGGLRSSGTGQQLMAQMPRNTRIATLHPIFAWAATDDFEVYRIRISTDAGTHWEGETTETSLAYPQDAPPLTPGATYFWQVSGEAMLDEVKAPMVSFEVPEQALLDRVVADKDKIITLFRDNPDGSTYHYVLGNYYIEQGLLASAIQTFSMIADQHPEAALPNEILGRLYTEVGLTDAAVKALQRALDLSRTP